MKGKMASCGHRSTRILSKLGGTLFLRADTSVKLPTSHHRTTLFVRGIKKLPRNKDKRDGHCVNPRDYYWEQRMKREPKSPLAVEPVSVIKDVTKQKKTLFTKWEKSIAVVAVISMFAAVVSFKSTFGNKKPKENTEAAVEQMQ